MRGFFRRLRIARPYDADEVKDAIPITLDGLEKWAVGDHLASQVLGGADAIAVGEALKVTGQLPPGPLGAGVLDEIIGVVRPLVIRALELRRGPQRTLDVDIDLGGGRRLSGTVGDVWGNNRVSVSFSTLAAKHRLAAWIDALALAAGLPDENWTVHTIGKHRSGGQVQQVGPLAQHEAQQWLRDLVALYDAGQCEPLPLPGQDLARVGRSTRRVLAGSDGDADAKGRAGRFPRFNDSGFPREDADPWHVRAFGEDTSSHPPHHARPRRSGRPPPPRPLRLAALGTAHRRRARAGEGAVSTSATTTFDIAADLQAGATLLEASAGTGKTWTIAALVTKHVASGDVRLDEMLVVTFTRAASQELRERVRRQLDEAIAAARRPGPARPRQRAARVAARRRRDSARRAARPPDPGAGVVRRRHHRHHPPVLPALVLRSLGVAAVTPTRPPRLVEDLGGAGPPSTVDDLYLARFGSEPTPPWTRAAALGSWARTVVRRPRGRGSAPRPAC